MLSLLYFKALHQLLESSSPFLFPCTIEYSLMCAAILYIMWKQVSRGERALRGEKRPGNVHRKEDGGENKTLNRSEYLQGASGLAETVEQIQPGLQQGQHGAVLGDTGADPHHYLTHPLLCFHKERRNNL